MRKKGEQKITTTKSFDIKRTTDIGFQKKKSFFAKGFWFSTLANTKIFLTGLIVNTVPIKNVFLPPEFDICLVV